MGPIVSYIKSFITDEDQIRLSSPNLGEMVETGDKVTIGSTSKEGSGRIVFTNANLVGWDEGKYTVIIEDKKIKEISLQAHQDVRPDRGEVIDLGGQWLSPVRIAR